MPRYRRPSPLELTYLAQDSSRQSPIVNQYFLEGAGPLSLDALRSAVHAAALAVPDSRLILRGRWGWRMWHDDGALPRVREVAAGEWNGMGDDGAPVLGDPLDVRRGPVCEVVWMRGSPDRLLFRTHHGVMDGAGTLFFMRQVFRVLRGEAPQRPTCALTEWDVARQHPPVARDVTLGQCPPLYMDRPPTFEAGCRWRRAVFDGTPSALGGKVLSIVGEWAREANVPRTVIRMPADLRRYLAKGEFTASNCSAALDIEITPGTPPKKMQAAIVAAMRNQQDLASIVPKAKWLHWVPQGWLRLNDATRRSVHGRGTYNYTCTVTNLGSIDLTEYSAPAFQSTLFFGVPIPLELTPLYIAFIQHGTRTSLHVAMPRALATSEGIDRLMQRLHDDLAVMEGRQR